MPQSWLQALADTFIKKLNKERYDWSTRIAQIDSRTNTERE
jgi:hypothetical protein